ncbi:MAG: hypothetical protein WCR67_01090 [Bacilli bacterium]
MAKNTEKEKDTLEKKEYYGNLLTIYGKLLSKTILDRMTSCYLDDLSITEIAQNEKVSRNAVFQSLTYGKASLDEYENHMGLMKRDSRCLEIIKKIEKADNQEKRNELLERLKGEFNNGI